MAEPLVLPRFPALEASPSQEDLDEGLAMFRAEFERCEDRSKKAALAHHMAQLLERRGDLAGAARDELSAANLAPGFTAPVETLIRIAQQSHSGANLDRLLARIVNVTSDATERERARLHRAFLLLEQGNVGQALEQARVRGFRGRIWLISGDEELLVGVRSSAGHVGSPGTLHMTDPRSSNKGAEAHAAWLRQVGIDGVVAPEEHTSAGLVALMHRFRRLLVAEGADYRRTARRALGHGADGVIGGRRSPDREEGRQTDHV